MRKGQARTVDEQDTKFKVNPAANSENMQKNFFSCDVKIADIGGYAAMKVFRSEDVLIVCC